MAPSTRHSLLVLFFVANTAFLCASSTFYSLGCAHYDQKCSQAEKLIAILFAASVIFYGTSCLISLVYYGRHHFIEQRPVCLINFLMSVTATNLVFSVVAGTGMLISLFFSFDPNSLNDLYNQTHFILMWMLVGYGAVSNGAMFLLALYLSYQHGKEHPKVQTPKIFVIPPDSLEIYKAPIV